jgi:hypothetical protein
MADFLQEQEKRASLHLRQFDDPELLKGSPLVNLMWALADRLQEENIPDLSQLQLEEFMFLAEDDPEQVLDCLVLLMEREDSPVPQDPKKLDKWGEGLILGLLDELNLYQVS